MDSVSVDEFHRSYESVYPGAVPAFGNPNYNGEFVLVNSTMEQYLVPGIVPAESYEEAPWGENEELEVHEPMQHEPFVPSEVPPELDPYSSPLLDDYADPDVPEIPEVSEPKLIVVKRGRGRPKKVQV